MDQQKQIAETLAHALFTAGLVELDRRERGRQQLGDIDDCRKYA
jgi:hypothetical protein